MEIVCQHHGNQKGCGDLSLLLLPWSKHIFQHNACKHHIVRCKRPWPLNAFCVSWRRNWAKANLAFWETCGLSNVSYGVNNTAIRYNIKIIVRWKQWFMLWQHIYQNTVLYSYLFSLLSYDCFVYVSAFNGYRSTQIHPLG